MINALGTVYPGYRLMDVKKKEGAVEFFKNSDIECKAKKPNMAE